MITSAAAFIRYFEGVRERTLLEKRPTLDGQALSLWRMLLLLVEHEVHHRSQVSQYLVDLGLEPPQIFGKRVEELPRA